MSAFDRYFGDTHRMIRETTSKFVDKEILPYIQDWEDAGVFPVDVFKKAGDAGLLGIAYPEELGGTGGDLFQMIAYTEEIMRSGSSGFVATIGSKDIGLPPILHWGSDAIKEKVIPPVLRGEKIAALAITEPNGGSDVARVRSRAVRDGDEYIVNGSKTFITSGTRADYYTVAVRTGGEGYEGISLLLIEKGMPGFSVGKSLKKMGWQCSDTAELFFEDCRVPVENLIGEENQGFFCITSNFQNERLALAVMANSTAEIALEQCMGYVKEREAFGRAIGEFQVTKHKLAEMGTLVEASKAFTYSVAERINDGESVFKEVSMAKNFATDVSDRVTFDAVQLFGGSGFMRGTLVERLYRDNRILSIGGGTREIMNEIISKQMGL